MNENKEFTPKNHNKKIRTYGKIDNENKRVMSVFVENLQIRFARLRDKAFL